MSPLVRVTYFADLNEHDRAFKLHAFHSGWCSRSSLLFSKCSAVQKLVLDFNHDIIAPRGSEMLESF